MTTATRVPWMALRGRAVTVLLALEDVYQRDGRATCRTVAARAGIPLSMVHPELVHLRERGFCTWDDGKQGSLRPLVEAVDSWWDGANVVRFPQGAA